MKLILLTFADPPRQREVKAMRGEILAFMRRTGDPFAEAFANREDKTLVPAVLKELSAEYSKTANRNQDKTSHESTSHRPGRRGNVRRRAFRVRGGFGDDQRHH